MGEPTMFTDVRADTRIVPEGIFGPIAAIADSVCPLGSYRSSGIGRELEPKSIETSTRVKSAYLGI